MIGYWLQLLLYCKQQSRYHWGKNYIIDIIDKNHDLFRIQTVALFIIYWFSILNFLNYLSCNNIIVFALV